MSSNQQAIKKLCDNLALKYNELIANGTIVLYTTNKEVWYTVKCIASSAYNDKPFVGLNIETEYHKRVECGWFINMEIRSVDYFNDVVLGRFFVLDSVNNG